MHIWCAALLFERGLLPKYVCMPFVDVNWSYHLFNFTPSGELTDAISDTEDSTAKTDDKAEIIEVPEPSDKIDIEPSEQSVMDSSSQSNTTESPTRRSTRSTGKINTR